MKLPKWITTNRGSDPCSLELAIAPDKSAKLGSDATDQEPGVIESSV